MSKLDNFNNTKKQKGEITTNSLQDIEKLIRLQEEDKGKKGNKAIKTPKKVLQRQVKLDAVALSSNKTKETKPSENTQNNTTKSKEAKAKEIFIDEAYEYLANSKIDQVVIHGGSRKFKNAKEYWSLTPDLDAQSSSIILGFLQKRDKDDVFENNSVTSIIPKGGSKEDLEVHNQGMVVWLDAGKRSMSIENDDERYDYYFDHHNIGRSKETSATEMMYDFLKEKNLLKDYPWLENYVKNITSFDNLSYVENKDKNGKKIFDEKYFTTVWPFTFNHLAAKIDARTLMKLFESKKINSFSQELTQEQLKGEIGAIRLNNGNTIRQESFLQAGEFDRRLTKEELDGEIGKIKLGNGKTIKDEYASQDKNNIVMSDIHKTNNGINIARDYTDELGFELANTKLGNIVYQNFAKVKKSFGKMVPNIIPDHLAFLGTKSINGDTYINWNQKKGTFFINSNHPNLPKIIAELNKIDPDCATDIRGVMVYGKIKNLTEEKFLNIIDKKILGKTALHKDKEVKIDSPETVGDVVQSPKPEPVLAKVDEKISSAPRMDEEAEDEDNLQDNKYIPSSAPSIENKKSKEEKIAEIVKNLQDKLQIVDNNVENDSLEIIEPTVGQADEMVQSIKEKLQNDNSNLLSAEEVAILENMPHLFSKEIKKFEQEKLARIEEFKRKELENKRRIEGIDDAMFGLKTYRENSLKKKISKFFRKIVNF